VRSHRDQEWVKTLPHQLRERNVVVDERSNQPLRLEDLPADADPALREHLVRQQRGLNPVDRETASSPSPIATIKRPCREVSISPEEEEKDNHAIKRSRGEEDVSVTTDSAAPSSGQSSSRPPPPPLLFDRSRIRSVDFGAARGGVKPEIAGLSALDSSLIKPAMNVLAVGGVIAVTTGEPSIADSHSPLRVAAKRCLDEFQQTHKNAESSTAEASPTVQTIQQQQVVKKSRPGLDLSRVRMPVKPITDSVEASSVKAEVRTVAHSSTVDSSCISERTAGDDTRRTGAQQTDVPAAAKESVFLLKLRMTREKQAAERAATER
jgi:hypothetical protein